MATLCPNSLADGPRLGKPKQQQKHKLEHLVKGLRENAERVLVGVGALEDELRCGSGRSPSRELPMHSNPADDDSDGEEGEGNGSRSAPRKTSAVRGRTKVPTSLLSSVVASEQDEHEILQAAAVLEVPRTLALRWKHAAMIDSESYGRRVSGRFASQAQTANLQVDSRWRELFLANEFQLDLEDEERENIVELATRAKRRGCRTSKGSRETTGESTAKIREVPLLPHGGVRIVWDLVGMLLMLYDFITLPVYLSWGIDISSSTGGFAFYMVAASCAFWTLDVVMNFNTGFYTGTALEMRRGAVVLHYLRSWFILDLTTVVLDVLILASTLTAAFRTARVIRAIRLVRIAKISKLNMAIEDLCASFGVRWLILVYAIMRNLLCIFLLAHVNACVFYIIGADAQANGRPSWLDLAADAFRGEGKPEVSVEYVRALYWVLGHLTAAPVDSSLTMQTQSERLFTVGTILVSLFVIGGSLSSMTSTIAELGKLNSDFVETKRQLQSYLKSAGVHWELSARIITFALHSYTRRKALSLDASVLGLLSERLKSELAVNQRSRYFLDHPLFSSVKDDHPEVFRDICEAFQPNVYADRDVIFHSGRVAKCMYVTHSGTYSVNFKHRPSFASQHGHQVANHRTTVRMDDSWPCARPIEEMFFSEPEWICEVGLYTKFVHQCTMQSVSFADAFTLTCQDILHCVSTSPRCAASMYRYAQEYVTKITWVQACMVNFVPMELVSLQTAREVYDTMQQELQPWIDTSDLQVAADFEQTEQFLSRVSSEDICAEEFIDIVPTVFRELWPDAGLYSRLEMHDERKRVMCSMLSVVFLLKDRYTEFVDPQSSQHKMSPKVWKAWQAFVEWADVSEEQLHAVLVFLVIRGLGKSKFLQKAVPSDMRSPEDIVMYLMENIPNMVPSFSLLTEDGKNLVGTVLSCLKRFSMPQLLQGENTPWHVQALASAVETHGQALLKFYFVCQVAVMCGLGGADDEFGSSFMTEQNSSNVLAVISFLRKVGNFQSHAVYWGYILARAQRLGFAVEAAEEIAVARLACLCRTLPHEREPLLRDWRGLGSSVRRALTQNLLADGIQEVAFVFNFLPLYLANAKDNSAVGLRRALLLLVDILEVLLSEGCAEQAKCNHISVDLQEVAIFARDAGNPRVFLSTSAHLKLVQTGNEVQLLIAAKHKERLRMGTWQERDSFDMTGILRKLERKVDHLQAQLEDRYDSEVCLDDDDDSETSSMLAFGI